MTDYTPTTEEVRETIIRSDNPRDVYAGKSAEFDRWLAEVKAQAWEEGYAAGDADAFTIDRLDTPNPYRDGEPE